MLSAFFSPLRQIKADPDQLAVEASDCLRDADRLYGKPGAETDVLAAAQMATAKVALATYLRTFNS